MVGFSASTLSQREPFQPAAVQARSVATGPGLLERVILRSICM